MKQVYKIEIFLNDWEEIEAFTDKLTIAFVKEEDRIFSRPKLSGFLKFANDGYLTVRTWANYLDKTQIRIYQNGTLQVSGFINLKNITDEYFKVSENNIQVVDKYFNLLDGADEDVNILAGTTELNLTVDYDPNFLTLSTSAISTNVWYTYTEAGTGTNTNIYAIQERRVLNHVADLLNGTNGWTIQTTHGDGTKTIQRDWDDSPFAAPQASDFTDNIDTPLEDENLQFVYFYSDTSVVPPDPHYVYLEKDAYYDSLKIYNNARSFYECVKELVQTLDNTILFDETGTSTDSFYYMKTLESTNDAGEYPYLYLLVAGASDIILENGQVRENPQSILNWTFRDVERFLRQSPLNIYWELEERGSDVYFVTKHKTEVNKSVGSIDLTNYKGRDWVVNNEKYEYIDNKEYNRLSRHGIYGNTDFIGKDIQYPNIPISITKEITEPNFFNDLQYCYDSPGAFPDTSLTACFVICADLDSGTDYIARTKQGELSGNDILNAEMSIANLDEWFFANGIAEDAIINGNNVTLTGTEINYLREIPEITIPIFYIKQQFQFDELVALGWANAEIQEVSQNCTSEFGKIKLKF